MKKLVCVLVLTLVAAATMHAQEKAGEKTAASEPAIFVGNSDIVVERGSTRLSYFNRSKKSFEGQFFVNYGRPVWKAALGDQAKFDEMTKGKVWRVGTDYWTTLDNGLPIRMGGKDIPLGLWYLGIHRSEDGASWSLVFVDPVKARQKPFDASGINRAPVEFKVPMTFERSGQIQEKLTMVLSAPKEDPKNATLKISWGNFILKTAIQIGVEG